MIHFQGYSRDISSSESARSSPGAAPGDEDKKAQFQGCYLSIFSQCAFLHQQEVDIKFLTSTIYLGSNNEMCGQLTLASLPLSESLQSFVSISA